MPDLDTVRALVAREHGLASVALARADGTVQASVVNAGINAHPVRGEPVVGLVVRGDSLKHRLVRRTGRAAVTWRAGWEWVTVEGPAELCGPDDPMDGVDADRLRSLLREVFQGAGGTHDDFETYDRVMADERRLAVLVAPERIYGVAGS